MGNEKTMICSKKCLDIPVWRRYTLTIVQAHLLFRYGKIRNKSKDIAVYHGSFGHQRDAECLHPCAVR